MTSRVRQLLLAATFLTAVAVAVIPAMMGTGYFSLWARPGEATAADLARVLVSGIATAAAIATLVFLIGTIADRRRVREMRAELAVWPDPPSSVNAASARKGTPSSRPKG